MKKLPLVSIIVPTKNSAGVIKACLKSIKNQSYENIELIVVDNYSTDKTPAIAKRYTNKVYTKGPERCVQRNFGVNKSSGDYVAIIDSDMELNKDVIEACVQEMQSSQDVKAVVIPEESFGEGFWAQCKKLERSFYVGVPWMEAARFFDKKIYKKLGGYDEAMVSGEDWDLSQRVARSGKLGHIDSYIMHNEGRLRLGTTLNKKYYYARQFASYMAKKEHAQHQGHQTGILTRYKLFFSQPKKLLTKPHVGIGMLFMKTCEFGFGGAGYLLARRKQS